MKYNFTNKQIENPNGSPNIAPASKLKIKVPGIHHV
jgi:hypothetical protein